MEGWISIHRRITEHPDYFSEQFTRMGAWIDLLLMANHKPNSFRCRGIKMDVERGSTAMTQETLAKRWRWSRGKVKRFLDELEKDGQIVRQKSNVTTIISVCNYEKYQTGETTDGATNETSNRTTDGQQTEQQTDINNNDNNVNNDNKEKLPKGSKKIKFLKPTIEQVSEYCLERGSSINPQLFIDHYESKGWMVGSSPMKDWKAAVRTWENKQKEHGTNINPIRIPL